MSNLAELFIEQGFDARIWTYGYAYALLTRWQNPGRAHALKELLLPGDIVVGHSNGGALAWMAAELGAPLGGAVLINPALDSDKALPEHVPWINLYPNRHDRAVGWAKLFGDHPWGSQGRDGLAVQDSRYLTRFTDEEGPDGEPVVWGHSAVLTPDAIVRWGRRMALDAAERTRA